MRRNMATVEKEKVDLFSATSSIRKKQPELHFAPGSDEDDDQASEFVEKENGFHHYNEVEEERDVVNNNIKDNDNINEDSFEDLNNNVKKDANSTEDNIEESKEKDDEYIIWDLKTSIRSGEQQNKVVSENIEKVENHFPHMVQDINLYAVRSAKLRDAGDQFSKSLRQYASTETPALQHGLSAFAECFAAVQDHRNALVTRLENKVVQGFTVYDTRCKQARLDVKQHTSAHVKEVREHKSFENVKAKTTQQFELAKAETKFKKAAEEANRSAKILSDQVCEFERQKIRDLKKVFGEFMLSEMMFYAKALEIYTRAYQELNEIDEDENVDQLQQSLKFTPHQFTAGHGMYGGSAPALTSPQQNVMHSTSISNPQLDRTY